MMRALVYDPYLDTLGGGERYTLSVARVMVDLGYEVDLLWDDEEILEKLGRRFGMDVSEVCVKKNFLRGVGSLERWRRMKEYDLSFWVSDGSVPFLFAKKNLLHFQVPFSGVGGGGFLAKLKFRKIDEVVCNSEFTRRVIEREYEVKGVVVYPPVAVGGFRPLKKKNLILSVGRFSQLKQAKRQDVLIEVFRKMIDGGFEGWKLVLAGGSEVGKGEYFDRLLRRAEGYPIEVVENPSFDKLKILYGGAKIFWSAAGFGVDEEREAERVEHFGMAVVEAMAAGAVPVVYWAGGHKEIVRCGEDGEGWRTEEELVKITQDLVSDHEKWGGQSLEARARAQNFSEVRFQDRIRKILRK